MRQEARDPSEGCSVTAGGDRRQQARRAGTLARGHGRAPAGVVAALALLLVVLAALVAPMGGAMAAPAMPRVTLKAEAGYGRMVLSFADRDRAPQHTLQFNNGVAVLRFDEPVQLTADSLPAVLPRYVIVARRDPDGAALRIAVQRQVRINVQSAGAHIFIDFLPSTWTAAPPPIPADVIKDLADRARLALDRLRADEPARFGPEAMPRLSVQVARRPDVTRLAFAWNVPFSAELTRDGDAVKIGFDRAGRADLAGILANLPPGLTAVDMENVPGGGGTGSTVTLTVAPDVQVRGFRDDQSFVVDLTLGAARPSGVPASAKAAIDLAGATELAVAPPPPSARPTAKLRETALPASDPVSPTTKTEDLPADESPAIAGPPALPGTVRVERSVDGARLTALFSHPVPAAVFQRQDSVFFVVDETTPLILDGVEAALGGLVRALSLTPLDGGQVLRLDLARPLLATAAPRDTDWQIHLGDDSAGPRQSLEVRRVRRGASSEIAVDLGVAGGVHRFVDPTVGDPLVVVTALGPVRGVLKPYAFVGGALLPTAHGVAVIARADDLGVAVATNRVEVTRPGGLALSPDPALAADWLDVPGEKPRPRRPPVDASTFEAGSEGLLAEERALRAEILDLKPAERAATRLKLARLYIGLRLAPEALGTLRLASDEQPALARDPAFVVLYAAGQALMGRSTAAREALSRAEVADNPDAAFWRAIATVAARRFDEGRAAARLGESVANAYPTDLAAMFRLAAAEAEIELGDAAKAQTHLARVDTTGVPAELRGALAVLQGRVLDATGKTEEAQKRYDEATASGDRRAEAEAEYRRVTQAVRDGKMPGEEAVKRLQSLAFFWRGDQTELRTLRALGNLQAQIGRWRDAFTSMRSADLIGPNSDDARLLQVDMAREFAGLYLDGKADTLDPIEALALYYDFRQLTPPGRLGDEIVRRLADRLVGVDLLDQAADLLAYQVDNRLRGAARAQIAADLAAVHLMNRKPAEALAVLSRTDQSGLTAGVERQRRLVRARALADTGAIDQGLMLLTSIDGDDAARLSADILWRARRWDEAGWALTVALGARAKPGAALDEAGERDVLKAAVAFALGGDEDGLARLVTSYGGAMAKGGSANAFAVVTRPTRTAADLASVAGDVAAADRLRGFLDEYRKRYMGPSREPGAAQASPKPAPQTATPQKPA